jgi:hypothetical protein
MSHEYPQYQAPAKRGMGAGKIVLIVIAVVFALCVGGSVLAMGAIGGGAAAVKHDSDSKVQDITITSCEVTVINSVEIAYTIVNHSKAPRSYMPRFRVTATGDAIVSDATDITQAVPAGATLKGKAVGMLAEADNGKLTCSLVDA